MNAEESGSNLKISMFGVEVHITNIQKILGDIISKFRSPGNDSKDKDDFCIFLEYIYAIVEKWYNELRRVFFRRPRRGEEIPNEIEEYVGESKWRPYIDGMISELSWLYNIEERPYHDAKARIRDHLPDFTTDIEDTKLKVKESLESYDDTIASHIKNLLGQLAFFKYFTMDKKFGILRKVYDNNHIWNISGDELQNILTILDTTRECLLHNIAWIKRETDCSSDIVAKFRRLLSETQTNNSFSIA